MQILIALSIAVVTAYSPGDGYTPAHGITASGEPVIAGWTVAADTDYHPMGTRVWIEGVGVRQVMDRGSAIQGPHRFDVYMPAAQNARDYGIKRVRYQVMPEHQLYVWWHDQPVTRCSYTPVPTGAYTSRHCLAMVLGPGFTVYAGTHRVHQLSLDPTRDLAHMIVPGRDVTMRTPRPGEVGHTEHGVVLHEQGRDTIRYANGAVMEQRVWCTEPGQFVHRGASGSGVYGDDGALLGIYSGGLFSNDMIDDYRCGHSQSAFTEDVP